MNPFAHISLNQDDINTALKSLQDAQQRAYRTHWPLLVVGDEGIEEYSIPQTWWLVWWLISRMPLEGGDTMQATPDEVREQMFDKILERIPFYQQLLKDKPGRQVYSDLLFLISYVAWLRGLAEGMAE